MGILESIERNYGCVAEYNRVMEEEYEYDYELGRYVPRHYEEPTEEEQFKNALDMHLYNTKIKYLSGKPSDYVLELKEDWKKSEPVQDGDSYTSHYAYKIREWDMKQKLDIIDKLCTKYGVTHDTEWGTFYDTPDNTFSISVEYSDSWEIKHIHIGNLDYDTFKNLFRDLREISYPTMNYRKDGHSMLRSNCSLGELRIYDFKIRGIETNESLEKALEEAGYNEAEVIETFTTKYRSGNYSIWDD